MGLRGYLIQRIAIAIVTLWVVATLIFFLFVVFPADPTRYLLDPNLTQEQQQMIRREYGWDDPLPVKYVRYMRNLFTFGVVPPYFGVSFQSRLYVSNELSWRLPLTVGVLGMALIGNIIIGIPVGVLSAAKRGTKLDMGIMTAGLFTYGVPTFFVQLLALFFLVGYVYNTYGVSLFPSSGWVSYPRPAGLVPLIANIAWHFSLPALTLVISGFAGWSLFVRNMLLDSLTQDYVLTARAKGVSERTVLFKHALKGIYPPIVTLITLSIPGVVTGAIITEQIFGLEGIGQWYVRSISLSNPDYPVVQAILFIFALLTIICNLIADFLYGVLDPRIRVGMRR
jgi:peptide/nickel transport system permease protein